MTKMKLIIILFVLPNLVRCFNLDPKSAINITDPSSLNNNSYFGYAVQFFYRSTLIVGAPKTRSEYDALHPSGAVYDCLIEGGAVQYCKPIRLYPDVIFRIERFGGNIRKRKRSNNEYKKDAWIGGALSVNEKTGVVTVCGAQRENMIHLNGVCYAWSHIIKWANYTEKLFLLNINKKEYFYRDNQLTVIVTIPFYSLQEAGIFVRSFDDDIIVGTPGVLNFFNWEEHDRDQNEEQSTKKSDLDSYFTNDTLFQSYFGYSIDGGKFFKNQTKSYIFGTPSVGNYTGNVFVFDVPKNWNGQKITPKLSWKGQQMGEYFGEAVCVADLNSDGYDDILVGAPRHSGNDYGETRHDKGKVYVFLNTGEGNFKEMDYLAGSKISGAKFGSAISYIGDLDHDGFPEIAVGAPYEQEDSSADNTGCIYIYKGGMTGISRQLVQRIRSEDVGMGVKGFGISISKGLDVDGNNYNDISVGAHESGHVILIKSRPLVNISHSVKISDSSGLEIQQYTTQFDLQICVKYEVPYADLPKNLGLNVEVTLDKKRAYFNSSGRINFTLSYKAALEIGNFSCTNKTVFLNSSNFENDYAYCSPFVIRLNYFVAENLSTEFCATCPVMNQSQSCCHVIKIPFKPKRDKTAYCPDWAISAELPGLKEPYNIESQFSTPLIVKVANQGGVKSTLKCIQIDLPKDTWLLNIPGEFKCSKTQENSWMCLNDEVFQCAEKKILSFDLGIWISKIGSELTHFNFSLFCDNENKTFKLSLKLKGRALEIFSKANPTLIDSDNIEGNTFVTLTHDYRILNSIRYSERVHFKCWIPENIPWNNSTLTLLESHNITVIPKNVSSCYERHVPPSGRIMNEFQSLPEEDICTYTCGYLFYVCSGTVDAEGMHVQIKVQISVETLELILKTSTHFNYDTFLTIFRKDENELKKSVGTRFNSAVAVRQWPYYVLGGALLVLVVILVVGILLYRKRRIKRRRSSKQE